MVGDNIVCVTWDAQTRTARCERRFQCFLHPRAPFSAANVELINQSVTVHYSSTYIKQDEMVPDLIIFPNELEVVAVDCKQPARHG